MSAWLASYLGVHRGESVALEIREGRRRVVTTRVVGLVDEPLGTSMYMDLQTLGRLMDEPNTFAGLNILVDPMRAHDLFAVLKRAPQALGVDFRRVAIANLREMSDQSITFIRRVEVAFAVIIAFGVVYNTARIAVAERAYELATLRVLGFTRREISTVLLGEIGVLAAPAVPLGCALGYGFSRWLSRAVSSDLFRFPLVVAPPTYAFGVGIFAAAVLASALLVRRRLDRLDLVAVLKARE
jgi:putative ABC transport system permease protein